MRSRNASDSAPSIECWKGKGKIEKPFGIDAIAKRTGPIGLVVQ